MCLDRFGTGKTFKLMVQEPWKYSSSLVITVEIFSDIYLQSEYSNLPLEAKMSVRYFQFISIYKLNMPLVCHQCLASFRLSWVLIGSLDLFMNKLHCEHLAQKV